MIKLMLETQEVPGAIAELGIFRAGTFIKMARIAERWNKEIYGIDSFEGMSRPGKDDGGKYKQHEFTNTSKKFIIDKLDKIPAIIIKGRIPRILTKLNYTSFSFVRLDLDHYEPTLQSLYFIWRRMNLGGIMCCHDYFPKKNILASKACNDFGIQNVTETTAWWRK